MKNILARQLLFIPFLYIGSKYLWDLLPIEYLPEILQSVISDILGPLFIMIIILSAFIYIFWKIPVLDKISQILFGTKPFIQGTWCGKLNYEWEDKKQEKTAFLVIKQTDGYSLHIQLLTDVRESLNNFSDIITQGGSQQILYTYSNKGKLIDKLKNSTHDGFCQLNIDNEHLTGIYFTDRKSNGELHFYKRNKKIVYNYEKAKKLFGEYF